MDKVEKFFHQIEKRTTRPEGIYGCWEWTGGKSPKGYGYGFFDGKKTTVHRIVYQLLMGVTLESKIVVRHKCDNPACWNLAHLEEGTFASNMQDMVSRGRQSRGENRPSSKLSEGIVRRIREEYAASKATKKELAECYGVTQSTIHSIVTRKTWSHV